MSAIAASFSDSPMAGSLVQGDFRTVRVKSEHVLGESIFVTALTMLKAAKKGIPAPGSEVRATFIKAGELPSTATH